MSDGLALKLLTRKLLKVTGPDALRFLIGMWTADFKRATEGGVQGGGAGYLLNTKGQAITWATFMCVNKNEFFFSVPEISFAACWEFLNKYLVADEVELAESDEFDQFFEGPNYSSPLASAKSGISVDASFSSAEIKSQIPDALDKVFQIQDLKDFILLPRQELSLTHAEVWRRKGKVLDFDRELSDVDFEKLRCEKGVKEWGRDVAPLALPLEFPFKAEISFHKGCYIGQEVIARATYRGHMVRNFCQFTAKSALQNDFVYSIDNLEKPVGKITSSSGGLGLGLARVSELSKELVQKNKVGSLNPIEKVTNLVDA